MKSKKDVSNAGDEQEKGQPRIRSKLAPVRWVNPAPNNEDRAWLDDNDDKLVELFLTLLDTIQPDGRFTSKFDAKSGRWLAILFIGSDEEGIEFDAMSVRGATAIDAALLLAYFHLVKFSDGWALVSAEDQGRWG